MTRSISDTQTLDLSRGDTELLPATHIWQAFTRQDRPTDTSNRSKVLSPDSRRFDWGESVSEAIPRGMPALQQVVVGTSRMLPRLQSMVAATMVDFLSLGRGWSRTDQIDVTAIVSAIRKIQRQTVGISESLIVPRHKALESSLLVPSGAYLAWLEADDEQSDQ